MLLLVSTILAGTHYSNADYYTPPVSNKQLELVPDGEVRNVILLIGDGMGLAQVTVAQFAGPGPDHRLHMQRAPIAGLVNTVASDRLITDSAASGTAISTGQKTLNGAIATLPDGTSAPTILEIAHDQGLSTGLVVTSSVTHATPAVFASHVDVRSEQKCIASQMTDAGVDVMLGGGRGFFLPQSTEGSYREDEEDLIAELREKKYTVISKREELAGVKKGKLAGFFAYGPLYMDDNYDDEPSLQEMTAKAIQLLSKNKKGFFLMVEGSQIDWACHENEVNKMVKRTLLFDMAVGEALAFAKEDGHTLVIVTADHETGGVTIPEGARDGGYLRVQFASGGHTPVQVPLFAFGPGAVAFSGVYENTDLAHKMADALGLKGLLPKQEHEDPEESKNPNLIMMGR